MSEASNAFNVPDGIYALSHSVGCLPARSSDALNEALLAPWRRKGGGAWPDWLSATDGFCSALATLLHTTSAQLCPQPSVSDGFFNLLGALPKQAKTTVLMHRDAFPSIGFVVQGLAPDGFRLRLADGNPADLSTWNKNLTDDIDVVLITHAHSNTGQLSPVREIAALARTREIISIVDIAQSAGVIPIDLKDWAADAVVGSCVKWLCGGPGAGFLWASDAFLPKLTPRRLGWFSHENPFEFVITDFRPAPSALKFWGGTPSIAPYVLARCGIEEILAMGVEKLRAHNLGLMAACLTAAGRDPTSLDPARRTATLCLKFPEAVIEAATAALNEINCHHDWRGPVLRLSFHAYNRPEDASRTGKAIAPFLPTG